MSIVILLVGPASKQKINFAKVNFPDYVYINPQLYNTHEDELSKLLEARNANSNIVIDWYNSTKEDRKYYINPFSCLVSPKYELKCYICANSEPLFGDPNVVFYAEYKKKYEEPTEDEGFSITHCDVGEYTAEKYCNKAVFFDITAITEVIGIVDHPNVKIGPGNIRIKIGVNKRLQEFKNHGYKLIALSNQERVMSGAMSEEEDHECIIRIIAQLRVPIDDILCSPNSESIYKRPSPVFAFESQGKFKLDLHQCIMVGHFVPDKEFSDRAGISSFINQAYFLNSPLN